MELTGKQSKQVKEALVSAFTQDELSELLSSCLETSLDEITSSKKPFASQVMDVVNWAKRKGCVLGLVTCAHEANPHNSAVAKVFADAQGWARETGQRHTQARDGAPGTGSSLPVHGKQPGWLFLFLVVLGAILAAGMIYSGLLGRLPNSQPAIATGVPRKSAAQLESELLAANILLTGPEARAGKEEDVRSWLADPSGGYRVLAEGCLTLLDGRKFRKPLHLDVINGKYVEQFDPLAQTLPVEKYGDLEKLRLAIREHWNEVHPDDLVNSFDNTLE